MPVETDFYKVPQAPQAGPNNLLDLLGTATQIQANQAIVTARNRENAKQQRLGEILTGAKTPDGKFDIGRAATLLVNDPLTASEAPEYAKKALEQNNLSLEGATKSLGLAQAKQELIYRTATSALDNATSGPDGQLGLDMSHVTRGLAQIKNAHPDMAGQIDQLLPMLNEMSPSERYKAVSQLGHMGATAAQNLALVGAHIKPVATPEGDIVAVDTRDPRKSSVVYRGAAKPVAVGSNGLYLPGKGGEPGQLIGGDGLSPEVRSKINLMVGNGVHPEIAKGLASGQFKSSKDPTTGLPVIIDNSTGQPVDYGKILNKDPAPASPAATARSRSSPAEPAAAAGTELDRSDPNNDLYGTASQETGLLPALKETARRIIPQVEQVPIVGPAVKSVRTTSYMKPLFEDAGKTMEAREALRLASGDLVRSLQQNPRFSEGERKQINKLLDIEPDVFDSPAALQDRMRASDSFLRNKLQRLQVERNSPTSTPEMRKAAESGISTLTSFLDRLNVPQKAKPPGGRTAPAEAGRSPPPTRQEIMDELRRRAGGGNGG